MKIGDDVACTRHILPHHAGQIDMKRCIAGQFPQLLGRVLLSATILKTYLRRMHYLRTCDIAFGRKNKAEAEADCDPQPAVGEQRPNLVQLQDSISTSNRLAPLVYCASVLVEIYPHRASCTTRFYSLS